MTFPWRLAAVVPIVYILLALTELSDWELWVGLASVMWLGVITETRSGK